MIRKPGRRVLLYGGCFDPPHHGHVDVVNQTIDALQPAETFILVSKDSVKHQTLSLEHRAAMARLAFNGIGQCVNVPETTHLAVKQLIQQELVSPSRDALFFLIGSDQAEFLNRWENISWLMSKVTFLVAGRARFLSSSMLRDGTVPIDTRATIPAVVSYVEAFGLYR